MKPKFFKSIDALRRWLATHGTKRSELWIGYYKKTSGKGGVVYKEALDEALCVGWIDGQIRSIDDLSYIQRWTLRRPTSIWSNVNVKKVEALIAAGRMQAAGFAAFARRKPERTGVYSFENDPHEFSPAYAKRFKGDKAAWAYFNSQAPSYRRSVTAYVMTAKQEATRDKRLAHVIKHSALGERIPQYLSPAPKRRSAARKA